MINEDKIENMSTEDLLKEVNKAIKVVLIGGQSYKIGSRQLTRADIGELRRIRTTLQNELSSDSGGLLDNTVVAIFDGR